LKRAPARSRRSAAASAAALALASARSLALALGGLACAGAPAGAAADAGGGVTGDPARGRAIVADRRVGMCLLCHSGPFPEEPAQGDLASNLRGAGARWSAAQLRERIVDPKRASPSTIMPAYGRADGLSQVAAAYRGQTLLTPAQIDDVVAFLATLRD